MHPLTVSLQLGHKPLGVIQHHLDVREDKALRHKRGTQCRD